MKSPSRQKELNQTPTKPTRDTEPDDSQRHIKIARGLTVLFQVFLRKRPTGYSFNAIQEIAEENDCLIPTPENVAILSIEEK